jgi:hypothetical protein
VAVLGPMTLGAEGTSRPMARATTVSRGLVFDLPRGIIMRNMRKLAFAMFDADPLVGRSVDSRRSTRGPA